jgi:hypothetical protein
MILPGEALSNLEWNSTDYFPVILTVPALSSQSHQQFDDVRNVLTHGLLVPIQAKWES